MDTQYAKPETKVHTPSNGNGVHVQSNGNGHIDLSALEDTIRDVLHGFPNLRLEFSTITEYPLNGEGGYEYRADVIRRSRLFNMPSPPVLDVHVYFPDRKPSRCVEITSRHDNYDPVSNALMRAIHPLTGLFTSKRLVIRDW